MPLLKLVELEKIYAQGTQAQSRALNGINLEFQAGDFSVISGPSGSGKTTLLNLMGGLDRPSRGAVYVDGIEINRLPERRLAQLRLQRFGFIFQAYNLIPVLTARENIEYIMLLQAVPPAERRRRVADIAARLGIEELLAKKPNDMSGGQQQRVAVARAVVSKPEIVFADEPTANLDSVNSEALLDLMKQLNRNERITFIFSTHDPLVMSKAGRRITLRDGRVV